MSSSLQNARILFLLVNDITHDQRIFKMAHTLKDAGAEISILGRKRSWSENINWENIELRRIRIQPESGPLMYLKLNRQFAKIGKETPWDIVVSNDFDTLLAGRQIAKKWNAKWVFDAHEYFTEVPELKGKILKKNVWHLLGKWCIPGTDLAMSVSNSLSRELSRRYDQRFHTIPNVPYHRNSSRNKVRQNTILYQGALNKGRGLEVAIKAMKQLPEHQLILAGEGDLSTQLRQLVRHEHLEDKVQFLGRVPPEELKTITEQACLGINLLAGNSLNYYYSLANKFFDYAQAGIPSINMNFPEYKSLVKQYHCGILLDHLNIQDYVDSINALKNDNDRYQLLCKGASKIAEDYHWDVYAPKLIRLYESLLD